ncbi:MAG: hypothetical protein AB8G16_11495 [Gammaproteobacteria bacterium]
MKVVAYISAALQLLLIPAMFVFLTAALNAVRAFSSGDPKMLAGILSQGIVTSLILAVPALVGAVAGWSVLRSGPVTPLWYRGFSSALSWLWLFFVPVGTLVGLITRRKLKRLIDVSD